jgi:uncharacterized damage-inducible protein DinB
MPLRDLMLPEFDAEMELTRRTLERVPEGRFDWKPHQKSTALGRLATHVSELPIWVSHTFEKTELDIAPASAGPPVWATLPSVAAILEQFDRNRQAARAALEALSDDSLAVPWSLKFAGNTVFTLPRWMVYRRMCMNHLVHHRAQLGVYLRLCGAAVPASYGPSAGER